MQKYLRSTRHLAYEFDRVEFVQVPRSQNMEADKIAKRASSEARSTITDLRWKSRSIPALKSSTPSQFKVKIAG